MVEVLVDGDLHREVERVAASGSCALGTERRLDAAAALARILLLLHLDHAVAHFDDVDHLARVELVLHRAKRPAARRAHLIGCIELEDFFDERQRGLRSRPERLAWLRRLLRLRRRTWRRRERVELRDFFLRAARHLFDQNELLLKLLVVALQLRQLARLAPEHTKQLLDLNLLRQRDAAQLLDVFFASEIHGRARD